MLINLCIYRRNTLLIHCVHRNIAYTNTSQLRGQNFCISSRKFHLEYSDRQDLLLGKLRELQHPTGVRTSGKIVFFCALLSPTLQTHETMRFLSNFVLRYLSKDRPIDEQNFFSLFQFCPKVYIFIWCIPRLFTLFIYSLNDQIVTSFDNCAAIACKKQKKNIF